MGRFELDGAVVAITGGAGGIGTALAEAFRGAGAVVVTLDLPGRGADHDLDVTDAPALVDRLTVLQADHGRLDVVVANAGIGVAGFVEDLDAADWDRTIAVNVAGMANTVRAAYPAMIAAGRGSIVLMASVAGVGPSPLLTPYGMSKHAVVGLGAGLRIEAARHGVGVTVVCPGPVDTPLLDVGARTPGMDVRRYLTASAGPAIAPAMLAAAVVDGVRRDRAVVLPGRARILAGAARHLPGLVRRISRRGVAAELRAAGVPFRL
jgi:NAD(P)-dependent dehydrogenase (short-subunit alcohol dehydrogenase family)